MDILRDIAFEAAASSAARGGISAIERAIIGVALRRITQHLIRCIQFLRAPHRLLGLRVEIRVMLFNAHAIGVSNLRDRAPTIEAERFVMILCDAAQSSQTLPALQRSASLRCGLRERIDPVRIGRMTRALLFLLCFTFAATSLRAQKPYTPPAGSEERAAIMDVLRVPCERDLKQKVIFRVQHLRVVGNFALARVVPLRPGGGEIDFSRTKYRQDLEEGAFDGEGEALLQRDGGDWKLLEWRFGASDTEVPIWLEKYGASVSLQR